MQLRQVLLNLIVNGVDVMREVDGPREPSAIKSQPAQNNELLLSVSDTGVGLPGTRQMRSLAPSLPPRLTVPAWDCRSAAPLLNRPVAACGLPTILRAAQDFVSHYLLTARHTIQLCRKIALDLLTAFTQTTPSFESMKCSFRWRFSVPKLKSRFSETRCSASRC